MARKIKYEEGGQPGMLIKSGEKKKKNGNTFRVVLDKTRKPPLTKISGPADAGSDMEDFDRERVKILHLDRQNRIAGIEETSIGALDSAIVHPRETLKGALLNNSASVMFIHNHPSSGCIFSTEDRIVYEKLQKAFDLVGITLLDGIVIGKECYSSMKSGEGETTIKREDKGKNR
jgi:DNA repair protein RadC